jgi:hypothetical protein
MKPQSRARGGQKLAAMLMSGSFPIGPNELDIQFGLTGQVKEILIFTDDHSLFGGCVSTNVRVGRLSEPYVQNVSAVKPTVSKIFRKSCWQLIVDQKLHDV